MACNKSGHCLFCLTIAFRKVFVLDVHGSKHGTMMVTAGETRLCGKHQCFYTSKT